MAGRRNIATTGVSEKSSIGTLTLGETTSSGIMHSAMTSMTTINGTGTGTGTGRSNVTRSGAKYANNKNSINFNPKLIFSQIVALQCFHYLVLGIIFQFDHFFFSTSITIDRIFTDHFLTVWTWVGWIDSSAILLSYLFG
jgi:Integral membrane protein S linking to the trans Golgi network